MATQLQTHPPHINMVCVGLTDEELAFLGMPPTSRSVVSNGEVLTYAVLQKVEKSCRALMLSLSREHHASTTTKKPYGGRFS